MDPKTFAIIVFALAVIGAVVYVYRTKGAKYPPSDRSDSGNDPTDPRNPSKF
jgi:hypothetical protein